MRFTPHQHITSQSDFQKIRLSGTRREGGLFCFNFLLLPEREPPLRRLGVIATKRFGNAVARNRAKRILRESFRELQVLLPPSIDVVLIARRGLRHAEHERIMSAMRTAFCALTPPDGPH
jgi:ribonuclease P protein component